MPQTPQSLPSYLKLTVSTFFPTCPSVPSLSISASLAGSICLTHITSRCFIESPAVTQSGEADWCLQKSDCDGSDDSLAATVHPSISSPTQFGWGHSPTLQHLMQPSNLHLCRHVQSKPPRPYGVLTLGSEVETSSFPQGGLLWIALPS